MKRIPMVVLAAVAALLVWAIASGGDPEPAPLPGSLPGATAGDADGPAADPLRSGLEGRPERAIPVASAAHRTEAAEAGTAPAGGAIRTIRGRIVDSAGQPVGGLELALWSAPAPEGGMLLPPPGANPPGEERQGTTAGDGSFAFELQSGRTGSVKVEDDEWVLAGDGQFQAAAGDVDLGDLEVLRAGRIAGRVLDGTGTGIEGVKVSAARGESLLLGFGLHGRSSTTTDAQGRFELTRVHPGTVWLRTASPSFLPVEREVRLGEGEAVADLVLELEPGAAISGQVLDDLGRPVAGIKVGARRKAERGNLSVLRFTPEEATVTDANGLFTLAGLEGSTAQVRAWGPGYAPATQGGVPVGTGNLVLRVSRLGVVRGVLVDAQGRPIAGSRVRASAAAGSRVLGDMEDLPMLPGNAATRTLEDGSFRIENVPPGTVTVRATGSGHRPVSLSGVLVEPGATVEGLRLVADRGATVEVTVLDPRGQPVPGAEVEVVDPPPPAGGNVILRRAIRISDDEDGGMAYHEGHSALGRGVTDEQGRVTIAGLPERPAQVRAEQEDYAAAEPVMVTLAKAAPARAELRLQVAGTARVTVVGPDGQPVADARFRLRGPRIGSDAGRRWEGVTDTAGMATIGSLPPGPYSAELELDAPGRAVGGGTFVMFGDRRRLPETRVEFAVRAEETVEVRLQRPVLGTVRGVVTDAQGPVGGALVELERIAEENAEDVGGTYSTRAAADGSYAVEDLSAGRYLLRYGKPEQIVKAEEVIELHPGQVEVVKDLRLAGGTVRITALSAGEGEPVEGAEVVLERADGPASGQPRRAIMLMAVSADSSGGGEAISMRLGENSARTDVDGMAEIEDVPPGTYTVRIRHGKHATYELPEQVVVDGGVTDCGIVELQAAGILVVKAVDAQGAPVPIAMVEYRPEDRPGEREVRTAMEGSVRLSGLTPGTYVLRAGTMGTGDIDYGPERKVEVLAGRNPPVELRTR